VAELANEVDALRAHSARPLILIAESDLNDPIVVTEQAAGGYGIDAQWNDDVHHALHALLTGERQGYYVDFGTLDALAKVVTSAFLHDGTYSTFRGHEHGRPVDRAAVPGYRFVACLQDHDQVGNRALGDRLTELLEPRLLRVGALLLLSMPFTPMLFMGEEYGEGAPFLFFSDHIDKRIAKATREGRRREFAAFAAFAGEEVPDPQDPATFAASKLTGRGARGHEQFVRELVAARRELGAMDAVVEAYDDDKRWLRVRRGPFELLMNFGRAQTLRASGRTVVLTTGRATVQDDGVRLGAMTGALVR
jgi:maltooligosyltrehalose trehalohydrolase